MTSLEKINLGNVVTGAREAGFTAPPNGRQTLAAEGKDMPQKTGVQTPVNERDTRLELNEVVRSVADFVQNIAREIDFSINEESGEYVVTVADSHTGEIIRQIPREEMIEISQHLAEFQRSHVGLKHNGLLFNSET